jgi:hypothetical protein
METRPGTISLLYKSRESCGEKLEADFYAYAFNIAMKNGMASEL